jgi:hypothetical protein
MENTYSVCADLLSKFHTSAEWIQAVWLVSLAAAMLGVTRSVMSPLRDFAVAARLRAEIRSAWRAYVLHDAAGIAASGRGAPPPASREALREEVRRLSGGSI